MHNVDLYSIFTDQMYVDRKSEKKNCIFVSYVYRSLHIPMIFFFIFPWIEDFTSALLFLYLIC